ncbi:MAG: hypothetical protein HC892_01465 [Saprospiraceae bacterium]|nr:hypothetical protein [Saprospiraceae bacterium]
MNVGQYRNTNYTYLTGNRTVTVYGITDGLSLRNLVLMTLQRNGNSFSAFVAPTSAYVSIDYSKPTTTCTAESPTIGGNVTVGTHKYAISFVINGFETLVSVDSNEITTDVTNKTVALTNIPIGALGTSARNIYRTNAGGSIYYLVGTINDNITTTFSDTTADNTTTVAPTISYCYDITWDSTINGVATPTTTSGDEFIISISTKDQTVDENLGVQNIINQSPEWSHYTDQVEIAEYTNQAFSATPQRDVIQMNGFSKLKLGLTATCGGSSTITITLLAPQKSTCVDTDEVNWCDITQDILGVASIIVDSANALNKVYYLNDINEERIMIKSLFSVASVNTLTISERKS